MKTSVIKSKLIPILTIILCIAFFTLSPTSGLLGTIVATILILIASFLEYKKELFTSLGFQKNKRTIKNLLVYAPMVSLALFVLAYILTKTIPNIIGESIDSSLYSQLKGNLPYTVVTILIGWVFGGFGEEIVWRGYFMKQFVNIFGNSKLSLIINIFLFAVLFGYFHAYQGVSGQIVTGILGAILSIIFYFKKYDLWFNIMVHGFLDTMLLIAFFKGWL